MSTTKSSSPPRYSGRLNCNYFIAIICSLSSFITIANCGKLNDVALTQSAANPAPSHAIANNRLYGDAGQRKSRSASYDDYYSSSASSDYDDYVEDEGYIGGVGVHHIVDDSSDHGRHGYLLPAKYEPQKFYFKSESPKAYPVSSPADVDELKGFSSMNLVTDGREDICRSCTCSRGKNAFLSITCDFQAREKVQPPQVFGDNLKIPADATTITIKLGPRTNFQLKRGFFQNNTVNSLIIEGTYSEKEQVELAVDAFLGNNGPYPEINIYNVFSVIVRTRAISGNAKMCVRNSNDLILYPDAFEKALINGLFVGIKDLRIQEKAFNSAQAKLRIEQSHIDNIYRFEASLREIRFINCTIGTINGGTFDVITINSIVFEECRIDYIKSRAITEKLFSNHVSITGAIIGSIEGEAINGSGIAELVLTKNKIDIIQENAIRVTALNATISHNNIKHLGKNWLHVQEWSNIVIEKNQFGVFGNMHLDETKTPVSCRFDGNSITKALPGSLNITNSYCVIRETSINLPCRCNLNWLEELSSRDLRSETYCTIDEPLRSCFNATTFNTLKYLHEVCAENKNELHCVQNQILKKVDGHFFTEEELESRDQKIPKLYFYIALCIVALILVCILVCAIWYCCRRRMKQSGATGHSHVHSFSDNDKQVIGGAMELMKKQYPKIYKNIKNQIELLLQDNISESKCIDSINKIANILPEGEDFVAFNNVLTRHTQPPTAPIDTTYSEPGGFYRSGTIVAMQPQDYQSGNYEGNLRSIDYNNPIIDDNGQTHLPEHIYAEPNCQQEPLLRNEYASPADRNMDNGELYAEPFQNERDLVANLPQQRLPQYSLPMRNQAQSTPTTVPSNNNLPIQARLPIKRPQNLPDVLHRGACGSSSNNNNNNNNNLNDDNVCIKSVKQRAQDLQSKPEFHPNELIRSNSPWHYNRHLVAPPVYASPIITGRHHVTKSDLPPPPPLASPESIADCEMDMRGATAMSVSPPDSGSNHSGGSVETVQIDDVIDYVDA